MSSIVPPNPKIYHIVHVDRLPSILEQGCLWSDREIRNRNLAGTTIGMNNIKERRLNELKLQSNPTLNVGDCVPFYFCPRSVMLYLISCQNHADLHYTGGQDAIIHLEADLLSVLNLAQANHLHTAFTKSNAGAYYFEDCSDFSKLGELNWQAIQARDWRDCKEAKQAEFLIEREFPWHLVQRIGVKNDAMYRQVQLSLMGHTHSPTVSVLPQWYY